MGQEEVIKILEKHKKHPLTSQEIAGLINQAASSTRRILRALGNDCSVNIKFRNMNPIDIEKKFNVKKYTGVYSRIRVYWLE